MDELISFPMKYGGRFLIYGLLDPRTLELRYIGKSTTGLKRPHKHVSRYYLDREGNTHKSRWINLLLQEGLEPLIVVLEEHPTSDSLNLQEREAIRFYRQIGCPLTNISAGGGGFEGLHHSAETRSKISMAHLGKSKSLDHRASMSLSRIGRTASSETRLKMSESHKKRSPDIRKAIALKLTGQVRSAESIQRMCDAQGARASKPGSHDYLRGPRSEATRIKISRKAGGRPIVDTTTNARFETVASAASVLGLTPSRVTEVLQGKYTQTKGHGFRYA